jgi:CRISPR-associated protein Csm1
MNLDELKLIFLLHDLGMFYQRTGKVSFNNYKDLSVSDIGNRGAHPKWSASLAEEMGLSRNIQEIILYHHKPESLKGKSYVIARILNKASEFFAENEERGAESLISVFSEVQITKNKLPQNYFIPVQKLDINTFIFPQKEDKKNNYENIWNEFRKELTLTKNNPDILYYLIKKYTSLIPSLSGDISLFDHIKITTAISTCLYKYMEGKPEEILAKDEKFFLLISGDLSGIQHFIYRVASPQDAQEGMAKRLRGRSLYLNLLNDAAVTRILDKLGLNESNVLWSGGGNFLLLAPNTEKASKELEELRAEIDQFLINKFNSELFLAMNWKQTSAAELKDFGKFKENLEAELSIGKKQKFIDKLDELFADNEKIPSKTCSVCDNMVRGDTKFCEDCNKHENLGRQLAYSKYYLRSIADNESDTFDAYLLGIGYKIIKSESTIAENVSEISKYSRDIKVFKLNDAEFLHEDLLKHNLPASFGFLFLANTVPLYEGQVLSFTNLSELSKGANKLGILRMDVDDLGKIFMKETNLARISTMSSMLDFYFSGILNKICENYNFISEQKLCPECKKVSRKVELTPIEDDNKSITVYRMDKKDILCKSCLQNKNTSIYINYAGGDDLLIIGPWDHTIELAKDIRKKFKEFTCSNEDIHISGGIYISEPKFPIGRAASLAKDVLEKSKDETGKNRMSVFNETVCWDTREPEKGFNEVLEFSMKLEDYAEMGMMSKGFIYSLLRMWHLNFGYGKPPSVKFRLEKKEYVPLFKYNLARTVKGKEFRDILDKEIQKMFPWIRVPVSWVSLRLR